MYIEELERVASSQFAYLILFIGLLLYVLRESNIRENKMREQLDKIVPILDKLVRDVSDIKNELKEMVKDE